MKKEKKKQKRLERQLELLKMFVQEKDHYEEKHLGKEWYIKSYNGGTGRWQVSVFSESSYRRYKSFERAKEDEEELDEKFKNQVSLPFDRPTLESVSKLLSNN